MKAKQYAIIIFIIMISSFASASSVPNYLNLQTTLYDDDGNLVPDGERNVLVRILDENMNVIFEEEQDTDVIKGGVTLTIGDGIDTKNGHANDGVGASVLSPDGTKYIELEAVGFAPLGPMELVSVPYSIYSQVAMGVEADSIGSDEIKKKSIEESHIKDELFDEIVERVIGSQEKTNVITRSEFEDYKGSLSGAGGAEKIGIWENFTYSGAENVHGVLRDFDFAIKKREEDEKKIERDNLSRNGSESMTGSLNMGSNLIENVAAPVSNHDAAPKVYVDNAIDNHKNNINNPHNVTAAQAGAPTIASFNSHAANMSNPHNVTAAQAGAPTIANLTVHTSNTNNPHSVTLSQVGAASGADFTQHLNATNPHNIQVNQVGSGSDSLIVDSKIRDKWLPDNIVRQPDLDIVETVQIANGRMVVSAGAWELVDSGIGNACTYTGEGTADYKVSCTIKGASHDCSSRVPCNYDYDVVRKVDFSLLTVNNIKVGNNYDNSIGITRAGDTCYCTDYVEFDLGDLRNQPNGAYVTWHLYKRTISE